MGPLPLNNCAATSNSRSMASPEEARTKPLRSAHPAAVRQELPVGKGQLPTTACATPGDRSPRPSAVRPTSLLARDSMDGRPESGVRRGAAARRLPRRQAADEGRTVAENVSRRSAATAPSPRAGLLDVTGRRGALANPAGAALARSAPTARSRFERRGSGGEEVFGTQDSGWPLVLGVVKLGHFWIILAW